MNRFCHSQIARVEDQGRTRYTRILTANLLSTHVIECDTDWNWIFSCSHNFCSMLIEQLIDLRKVRTDNLKSRTDLRDRVMNGWSVTQ